MVKLKSVGLGLLMLIWPLIVQAATPTATLKAVPTGSSVAIGATVAVNFVLDTGGATASAVGVKVSYPTDLLEYTGADAAGSKFDFEATAPASSSPIGFERLATGDGYNGASGQIIKLNFKAKAAGTANLTIDQAQSEVVDSGDTSNILKAVSNASITVTPSGATTATKSSPSPSAKSSPKTSPATKKIPASAIASPIAAAISPLSSPLPSPTPTPLTATTNEFEAVEASQTGINWLTAIGAMFLLVFVAGSGYGLWRYRQSKQLVEIQASPPTELMPTPQPSSQPVSASPASQPPPVPGPTLPSDLPQSKVGPLVTPPSTQPLTPTPPPAIPAQPPPVGTNRPPV